MIRRPPRSTRVRSSAASDVYKRQGWTGPGRSTTRSAPPCDRAGQRSPATAGGSRRCASCPLRELVVGVCPGLEEVVLVLEVLHRGGAAGGSRRRTGGGLDPVSYTHLTLPTILRV